MRELGIVFALAFIKYNIFSLHVIVSALLKLIAEWEEVELVDRPAAVLKTGFHAHM